MDKVILIAVIYTVSDTLTYVVYNWGLWTGKEKEEQPAFLWAQWVYIACVNATTYQLMSKSVTMTMLAWENAIMTIVTLATIIYHRKAKSKPLHPWRKVSAALCIASGIVFFVFRNVRGANFILQAGTLISMIPFYGDLWKRPSSQPSLPWGMWTAIYTAFAGYAFWQWNGDWMLLVYPLNYAIFHAAVFILTLRRQKGDAKSTA